ncbi:MAG TPA: GDSL-type esterase/lipase family protein [Pirellulales bacterium]|nr:GDSL-type esterase/lipase family protein [Pirellulales bacterium]
MNWLVYHIVSGHAFFTGVTLLIIAAVSSTRSHPIVRRVTVLTFLVGVIAVVVSSTAIPYWYYGIAVVATLAWIASRYRKRWRRWAPYAVSSVWLIAAFIELPYHFTHALRPTPTRTITIIGDSVTAGVGGDETAETWPSILAREHSLQVQDISHMGATAASALKRAKSHSIKSYLVVIEIGGNDLLGSTTSSQFARDLDALLAHLAAEDRQLIMFELPLPPFYHEYGRVQRSVAAKHNVALVPKRVFLSVIAGSDSTFDTIHLSQSGHQFMADCVWRLVKSAFEPNSAA